MGILPELFSRKVKVVRNGRTYVGDVAVEAPRTLPKPSPAAMSIDAFFAHDIHNREAQGILNRAIKAAKGLSAAARKDLEKVLKRQGAGSGEAILKFIEKYRSKLSKLLTVAQLASVLEGAREVAKDVPVLAPFHGAVLPPPTLEPKAASELVDRLSALTGEARALAVYKLPTDQQTYVQQAIAAKEAGGGEVPPVFTVADSTSESGDDDVRFPTIDEAVKHLSEKNVLTRDKFDALDAAAKSKSFTVANVSSDETLTKIRDALAKNVMEGADFEKFKDDVLSDVNSGTFLSDAHLETVFRTNVQSAFSDGQMTVLNDPLVRGGFPYASYYSIHDNRVREEHLELDKLGIGGTNIYRTDDPVFQTFRPPWSYNCVLPGNYISGQVVGALKAIYSGYAVEITSANGAKTTLTVHHPVLTEDGFVPAGQLKEGYNLLCHLGKREGLGDLGNIQNRPTLIEEVFKSFDAFLESKGLDTFNFDGDEKFMVGEVDVVLPHLFRGKVVPGKLKREDQVGLVTSNVRGVGSTRLIDSLFVGHSRPLKSFGSTLVADRNTVQYKSLTNCAAVNAKGLGDRVFRFSGRVETHNLGVVNNQSMPDCCRFGQASELDTMFSQPSLDGISFNPNFTSELCERFTSEVARSKVVNVRRFWYSGPVYDLETVPGYFTTNHGGAESIIIRNCRCGWAPTTVRHAAEQGVEEAKIWLETGVEPAEKAFVPMPDFAPPPGFQRSLSAAPLSIQLSLQPIMAFATDIHGLIHKGSGPGGGQFTNKSSSETPKGKGEDDEKDDTTRRPTEQDRQHRQRKKLQQVVLIPQPQGRPIVVTHDGKTYRASGRSGFKSVLIVAGKRLDALTIPLEGEGLALSIDADDYPRNASNQFLDKCEIAEAARDSVKLVELRESLPEDQRWKLDRAVSLLQSGGTVNHPKEPEGLGVNISGEVADPAWAEYERAIAAYEEWESRVWLRSDRTAGIDALVEAARDLCTPKKLDKAITSAHEKRADNSTRGIKSLLDEAIKEFSDGADEVDTFLKDAGATESQVRSVARLRHRLDLRIAKKVAAYLSQLKRVDGKQEGIELERLAGHFESLLDEVQDTAGELLEAYEDIAEDSYDCVETEAKEDCEPDKPEEPSSAALSSDQNDNDAPKQQPEELNESSLDNESDTINPTQSPPTPTPTPTPKTVGREAGKVGPPEDPRDLDRNEAIAAKNHPDLFWGMNDIFDEHDLDVSLNDDKSVNTISAHSNGRNIHASPLNGGAHLAFSWAGVGVDRMHSAEGSLKPGSIAFARKLGKFFGQLSSIGMPIHYEADDAHHKFYTNALVKAGYELESQGTKKLDGTAPYKWVKKQVPITPPQVALSVDDGGERKKSRLDLIAEILVAMFGDGAEKVAKALAAEGGINAAMAFTPQVTRRYGRRPGPGWRAAGISSRGTQIWLWGAAPGQPSGAAPQLQHAAAPQVPTPQPQAAAPPPPPPPPQGPVPVPQGPTPPPPLPSTGGGTRARAQSIAAYNDAMAKLNTPGQFLTNADMLSLSKKLSNMPTNMLRNLHAKLTGNNTAFLSRGGHVAGIKAILTGQPTPQQAQPPQAPQPQPQPQPQTQSPPSSLHSTIPFKDETTWTTGKEEKATLNGVEFAPAPPKFWEKVKDVDVKEPLTESRHTRAGILIMEPDGRIWICQPTNGFGRRNHTLPGGTVEPGLTDQQNALKETWEETGLQCEITGYLGDFDDANYGNAGASSRTGRLYIGRRIGGAPWDAKVEPHIINRKTGKPDAESETVKLVTPEVAAKLLHRTDDLAQLMTVAPIPLTTTVRGTGSEPLKKFIAGINPAVKVLRERAKAKAVARGQWNTDETGDWQLYVIQHLRGFNGKPKVISKTDFDSLIAQGGHHDMLRGIGSIGSGPGYQSSEELAEQFKSGDHYPGYGCFGNGTYADSSPGHNNQAARYYGAGRDKSMIRIALPKTAKIITQSELEKIIHDSPDDYHDGKHSKHAGYQGAHAALAGYDAIWVDGKSRYLGNNYGYGKGYYVILNRSICVVQKEDARGHVIT